MKIIALSTSAYIEPNQINLYQLLQSKFPGKDVENDAEDREQYLYYLKVCGGYYADKNADKMDRLAGKNVRQQQRVFDQLWRTLRVRQMVNNDDGSAGDDSDSDAASLSADNEVQEGALVVDEHPELTGSIVIPDSDDDDANEPSMNLPDTENILLATQSAPDSQTLSEDDDELTANDDEQLTDNGVDQLMVVSEDLFAGDLAVESESQSQPYSDVDMVPNATSTQTQK